MANRRFTQFFSTLHSKPVLLDCNFVVDSTNANGVNSLKGPGIAAVKMQYINAPAGTPPMGIARGFAILGASAVTNTGSSVLTGNIGVSPGSAITGFPPGTFSGQEHITDAVAASAQASALAAYNLLAAHASTVIPSALDGQTLTAGYYSFASGAATLAAAGAGTLTLSGSASDIFVIKTATTLTTGAGGIPTITLSGGALASNVYWVVGSSATINSGFSGVFNGNILAQVSITDTLGGTVNGSLVALTGAVTLSAATVANSVPIGSGVAGSPGPGLILVQFQDNYNGYYGGLANFRSPLSGSSLTSVVSGTAYVITALGTATRAQWIAKGLPLGMPPAVGVAFIASASGAIGGSAAVQVSAAAGSLIDHIEILGNPNASLTSDGANVLGQAGGSYMLLECFLAGAVSAPADGAVINLGFYLSNSRIQSGGE